MRLTDPAIARLRPREREYTVWDSRVPGLGVRVRSSGGRSYVLLQETEGRSKRVSLGPVLDEEYFGRSPRMPCTPGKRGAGQDHPRTTRNSLFQGLRGERMEGSLFQPLQAIDRRRASDPCSLAGFCPRSDRSCSTGLPRHRWRGGSMHSARPRRATPITPSTFFGRS